MQITIDDIKPVWNVYDDFRQFEVKADSLEDFMMKYSRHDRYYGLGKESAEARNKSYRDHFEKLGMTWMSKFESVTGEIVAYYRSLN